MKRVFLALALICGFAGAALAVAGVSASPAAACGDKNTT